MQEQRTESGSTATGGRELLERLELSLQVQRFLSRIVQEAQHLSSDAIQFKTDGQSLTATLISARKPIKSTALKLPWLANIQSWLSERVSWSSSRQPPADLATPAYSFHSSIRVGEQIVSFKVGFEVGLNRSKELLLSEFTSRSLKVALEELEVAGGAFERLTKVVSGITVVVAQVARPLSSALAPMLSLTNGHYAGPITPGLDLRALAEFSQGCPVLVSSLGDDCTDGLLQLRAITRDIRTCNLQGAVAQGTVKRVCPSCGRAAPINNEVMGALPPALRPLKSANYLVGRGCAQCNDSGYAGVVLVQSVAETDATLLTLLNEGANQEQLLAQLYPKGTRSMLEDGVQKCLRGRTTFEALFPLVRNLPASYLSHLQASSTRAPGDLNQIGGDFFESKAGTQQKPLLGRGAFTGNPEDSIVEEGPLFGSARKKRAKPLLLVVEDDRDQRSILDMVLRSADYDVQLAADGVEALEQIRKDCPDMVITDLMMPNMDGAELVKSLRANPQLQELPILVLTVLNDSEKEYKLLDIGADEYCEKTIQRKLLLKRVQNLLKRRG